MLAGMDIVPDTKDWTWVLAAALPGVRLRHRSASPARPSPAMLRENAAAWPARAGRGRRRRARPAPDTWSPLEYGCHVRDVFRLYDYRLRLMLDRGRPAVPELGPGRDRRRRALRRAGSGRRCGRAGRGRRAPGRPVRRVTGDQWERTGRRSDGAAFTVESFARYFVHDPVHHLTMG